MRILLLGDIRPTHLKRWRDYFRDRGHEVMTVSLEDDPSDGDYERLTGGLPVPAFKYYLKKSVLRRIIDEFKPDIVNAHFVPNYGVLAVAAGFRPLAVSLWGSDILISAHKSRLHRARALWVLRNCDLLTSDAEYLTQEARKLGSFETEIITEPMGIPKALHEEFGMSSQMKRSEEIVILSTRRLEPISRVGALIHTLGMARRDLPKFRCVIAGDGSERSRLEALADSFHLEQVEFVGWKHGREYIDLLKSADIYVSCSMSDSTSVSLLEAMSAGIFPVVSDIPGNHEWVTDKESATMFKVGDFESLAWALIHAIADQNRRTDAAKTNRETIRSRAIWEVNMARIEEGFEKLVSQTAK